MIDNEIEFDYDVTVVCNGCDWYNIRRIVNTGEDIELDDKNDVCVGALDLELLYNVSIINFDNAGNIMTLSRLLNGGH